MHKGSKEVALWAVILNFSRDNNMSNKIKVLVVDDSALMRALLTEIINASPDIEVVGTAQDPLVAREQIKLLNPDVLTLDVEMPRMDGLEFLEKLMRLRPLPVVMVSSLTASGTETTIKALELGAVDFICKPKNDPIAGMERYGSEICEKIRNAFNTRKGVSNRYGAAARRAVVPAASSPSLRSSAPASAKLTDKLIFIGASTGGTEAIKEVLMRLPTWVPGILIVQHMPEMFTASFAKRLDGLCDIKVKEAEQGERVMPGTAYIAPGHSHLSVRRAGGQYFCELAQSEPVNRHRPAVDVLFNSAAQLVKEKAVAAILTGMGKDGAQGMLAMKNAGAWTIGQDQDSCVVYGMPREAANVGALHEVATLNDIAARIVAKLGN